jgi:serine/threonine-protein kinase
MLEGFADVRELSSGTLAHVYSATELPLGRTVILKCLKPTLPPDSAFAQPLVREARILAALNHPNIEQLYRFIRTDRTLALVLEHVDGRSLRKAEDDRQLLSEEVMAIGFEIARGLAHAHAAGVVHGDLKPANVVLGANGTVKLIDFGIARASSLGVGEVLASRVAGPGLFGTPAYMSPEQLLSDEIDHRSDIYSLGVILYEALAGRLPIDRRAARDAGSRNRIEPLEHVAQGLPRPLCGIVMRCLRSSPSQRFQSADEIVNELGELLGDIDLQDRTSLISAAARGTPPIAIARKSDATQPIWRRPAAAAAAAVFFACLVVVTLIARQPRAPASVALPMAPKNAGSVRVTAVPWAEVWVDGERVDVTPIGRPIALSSGMHEVTFRHPKAPEERRRIEVRPGETVAVNVSMSGIPQKGGKP